MKRLWSLLVAGALLVAADAHAGLVQGGRAAGGRTGPQKVGVPVAYWSTDSRLLCWWKLDESGAALRACTGSLGAAGDLSLASTGTPSIASDTSHFVQGIASNVWPLLAEDSWLECPDADCGDGLGRESASNKSFTAGCAWRGSATDLLIAPTLMDKMSVTAGWSLQLTGSGVQAYIDTTPVSLSLSPLTDGAWNFVGLTFDDSADAAKVWLNTTDGSAATVSTMTANALVFSMGGLGGAVALAGGLDDCWFFAAEMSAADRCRVMNCGWDGNAGGPASGPWSAPCRCDPADTTQWLWKGRNLGCSMPSNCLAGGPS